MTQLMPVQNHFTRTSTIVPNNICNDFPAKTSKKQSLRKFFARPRGTCAAKAQKLRNAAEDLD